MSYTRVNASKRRKRQSEARESSPESHDLLCFNNVTGYVDHLLCLLLTLQICAARSSVRAKTDLLTLEQAAFAGN